MKKTALLLLGSVFTLSSFAQSTTATSTKNVSTNTLQKIKENIGLSYYNELYGRTFNDGKGSEKEALYNSVNLSTKIGEGKIALKGRFEVYETEKDAAGKKRSQAVMLNPRLTYSQVLLKNNNYTVFNGTTTEFGINDAKTKNNRLVKIKQYNGIDFDLNKRNTLTLGAELNRWFYDGGKEEANTNALGLYFEAIHKYSISDNISFQTAFEYDSAAKTNRDALYYSRLDNYSLLKIGPEFNLAKGVNLYTAALVELNQGQSEIHTNNTSLFVSLSATLL